MVNADSFVRMQPASIVTWLEPHKITYIGYSVGKESSCGLKLLRSGTHSGLRRKMEEPRSVHDRRCRVDLGFLGHLVGLRNGLKYLLLLSVELLSGAPRRSKPVRFRRVEGSHKPETPSVQCLRHLLTIAPCGIQVMQTNPVGPLSF